MGLLCGGQRDFVRASHLPFIAATLCTHSSKPLWNWATSRRWALRRCVPYARRPRPCLCENGICSRLFGGRQRKRSASQQLPNSRRSLGGPRLLERQDVLVSGGRSYWEIVLIATLIVVSKTSVWDIATFYLNERFSATLRSFGFGTGFTLPVIILHSTECTNDCSLTGCLFNTLCFH